MQVMLLEGRMGIVNRGGRGGMLGCFAFWMGEEDWWVGVGLSVGVWRMGDRW